ncbi:hypothetical protein QBC45DRAFT_413477 [Copromyces sp. CBS 386.78]|nr:hypothetical protein QBC45DRAFT_413477 [Copromyces sp. CBS 386.78]
MSTEPVPHPEAHEPNTKKKLVHHANAIEFARDRESEGLAGLIMWLPGGAKGLPRGYLSRNHPVVILSPALSADNTVEIVGMTSFGDKDLTRKFKTSSKGMKQRANYLPVEPTPPHPDTPERNVMLKMLPYSPRTPSYVDGSSNSRKTVLFSELREFYHCRCIREIHPRFYLDTDSYQKLAAFAGFSTVQLLHVPADPEVEKQHGMECTEQLTDTEHEMASIEPPSEDDHSQLFGPREPRPYRFIPQRPTPPTPPTPAPPPPGDDDVHVPPEPPVYQTPDQERRMRIEVIIEEVERQSRLHDMLSSQASDRLTPEQEQRRRVQVRLRREILESFKRNLRLNGSLSRESDYMDGLTPEQERRRVRMSRVISEELETWKNPRLNGSGSLSRESDDMDGLTPEQERRRRVQRMSRVIMEELETWKNPRLNGSGSLSRKSDDMDGLTPEQERRRRVLMGRVIMEEVESLKRNPRLNGSGSLSRKSDDGRSRSISATQTAQAGPKTKTRESASGDDAQKQTQDPDLRMTRRPHQAYNEGGLSRRARVAIILVIGGLGWKFCHSRLGGELLAEAVAGSEALKLVGRGLMGLSTAVARGVWAVTKHCILRHPMQYAGIGLVYGLWLKELYFLLVLLFLGIMFLMGFWLLSSIETSYLVLAPLGILVVDVIRISVLGILRLLGWFPTLAMYLDVNS